jgi:hypothetical protein
VHPLVGVVAVHDPRRDGELRGQRRLLAEDREFLDDVADVAVQIDQGLHLGMRPPAEAAAVVHELYQHHVALGIAADPVEGGVEDRVLVGRDTHLESRSASAAACRCSRTPIASISTSGLSRR